MDNNIIFRTSLKKRKEILHEFAKTNSSWKWRRFLMYFLFFAAAAIMVTFVVILICNPTHAMGVFIILCGASGLACVPYFFGLAVKNKSKYECAYPYSSYTNGTLILKEQCLQYYFWQAGPTEPAAYSSPHAVYQDEDKFIYEIDRNDIEDLTISDIGICRIVGKGKLLLPDDLDAEVTQSEINEISSDFSFALTFDANNINDIIIDWRNKNG